MKRRDRSLAALGAAFMVALVVYASLYPFTGWRWPGGFAASDLLSLPWARWRDTVDETFNIVGYLPVGLMMAVAGLRRGWRPWVAGMVSILACAALSFGMEVTQHLLPSRVPSLRDWVGNVTGGALGAGLALLLHGLGLLERWRRWRDRWFTRDSASALILLLLWPAGLLFPAPLPFGLGQCWDEASALLVRWLPLGALGLDPLTVAAQRPGLGPLQEIVAVGLSVAGPMALASAASPPGLRRLPLMMGLALLGLAAMTLSTALNFSPTHAWAWLTPAAVVGMSLGTVAALAIAGMGRRLSAILGLMALVGSVSLVAQVPTDAYFSASLKAWEQGRFIRFHGLAQWIGWLWPYAAMAWLVASLSSPPRPA